MSENFLVIEVENEDIEDAYSGSFFV